MNMSIHVNRSISLLCRFSLQEGWGLRLHNHEVLKKKLKGKNKDENLEDVKMYLIITGKSKSSDTGASKNIFTFTASATENINSIRNGNYFGAFGTRTSRNNGW